jgi:hypothetical protein
MAVSNPVRRYYAEEIFARMGRDTAPANFLPLEEPATGKAAVEGCLGGGKNITEFTVLGDATVLRDVRISCGLCNPAMYVAADIVVDWARGRSLGEILAVDPLDIAQLAAFFQMLDPRVWPDDAREKFQYALLGVQNAVRDQLGEPMIPSPAFDEPTAKDWADLDD